MISRRRFSALLAGVGLKLWLNQHFPAPVPTILSTNDWGALPPLKPPQILERLPKGIIIHHSARVNSQTTTRERAIAIAQAIQHGHFDRGWIDTGQHFTVTRGGWVLEGRHGSLDALYAGNRFVVGTHTPFANDTHLGIECEGTYSYESPPDVLWESLVGMCTLMCRNYDLLPATITPHRDWTSTECPGAAFVELIPALRDAVAQRLVALRDSAWPALRAGMWRRQVRAAQALLIHAGFAPSQNGRFDSATITALSQFQMQHTLAVTGTLGAAEWPLLVPTLSVGATGAAVVALHCLLRLPLSETFDAQTAAALKAAIGQTTCDELGWQTLVAW